MVVGSVAIATVFTDLFAYGLCLATFMIGNMLKRAEYNEALFFPFVLFIERNLGKCRKCK